mgnify:FL=1
MYDTWCKTKHNCINHDEILAYAKQAEWPKWEKRPSSTIRYVNFPVHLLEDSLSKNLQDICSKMSLMRMEGNSIFREHIDTSRKCGFNLCLHDGDFHTIILYPDVMFENKFENKNDPSSQWQFIENIGVTFDKVENEPGDFYLVNTSMKHAVINFSQLPRYSGFFDLKYDISYEDMKELL